MLSYWVDEFARYAARMRRRNVRLPRGLVKINLGAGLHVAEGWVNVDGSIHSMLSDAPPSVLKRLYRSANSIRAAYTESDYIAILQNNEYVFAQLEGRLPFLDNQADFIYSSHVLEHFFYDDAILLLREIHRVLKPGGVTRVCVPDLDYAMSLYQAGDTREALDFFFTQSRTGYYRQHRYMYNFDILAETLAQCGFVNVTRRGYQQGETPDLDILDNRPEETLYVEATKAS